MAVGGYIFPIVLFLLLGAAIGYTAFRIWHILPLTKVWKWVVTGLYVLCFLLMLPFYKFEESIPLPLAAAVYEIWTSWLIVFLYALLLFFVLDLGRAVRLLPGSFLKDSVAGTCTVFGLILALLVYGGIHYHHKYREQITVHTGKTLEKPLRLVLVSDLHAGYHNRPREVSRWVDLINAEHPDLVLVAGDLVDGRLRPVREWHFEKVFRQIEAPVYACLGNHEYIGGEEEARAFLDSAGVTLLKDRAALESGIRIVGRDDLSNPCRAALWELFKPDSTFTLVLDHQPYNLGDAQEAGADFQFSGHTHHGQVWPGNWVTDAMYEKAFGLYHRGNTTYYVSSGLGIWGGKFRIGTRSEYIVLDIVP